MSVAGEPGRTKPGTVISILGSSDAGHDRAGGRPPAARYVSFSFRAGARFGLLAIIGALVLIAGCATHPKGPHGPACQTIEGATHILEYPSQRLTILKRVAKQKELSTHEQIYLINAVFMGGFSDDMADALVSLLANPCCTAEARAHIRERMKYSRMVGRAERRLLEALKKYSPPEEQAAG